MRSIRMLGLALIGTVAVAGCGSDDGDRGFGPGNQGSMSATVTGDVTATLSGIAAFSVYDDGGTDVFELLLMSGSLVDATHVIAFSREGSRPANGTYPIGDAAGNMYGTFYIDATGATFIFTGGSVTITSSGAGGVSGTFTVQGVDVDLNTVSITGTFSSECLSDAEQGLSCG